MLGDCETVALKDRALAARVALTATRDARDEGTKRRADGARTDSRGTQRRVWATHG